MFPAKGRITSADIGKQAYSSKIIINIASNPFLLRKYNILFTLITNDNVYYYSILKNLIYVNKYHYCATASFKENNHAELART